MKYKDYSPTPSDIKGLNADEHAEWEVVYERNRDSDVLVRANWEAAKTMFPEHEVLGFNHWACGWVEVMIVPPEQAERVQEMHDALEDYPVLDGDLFCQMELEEEMQNWESYGRREFLNEVDEDRLKEDWEGIVLSEMEDGRYRGNVNDLYKPMTLREWIKLHTGVDGLGDERYITEGTGYRFWGEDYGLSEEPVPPPPVDHDLIELYQAWMAHEVDDAEFVPNWKQLVWDELEYDVVNGKHVFYYGTPYEIWLDKYIVDLGDRDVRCQTLKEAVQAATGYCTVWCCGEIVYEGSEFAKVFGPLSEVIPC